MKLWLDAKDLSTMDQGTSAGSIGAPTNNSNVKYWADKSGNEHHATSTGSPKYILTPSIHHILPLIQMLATLQLLTVKLHLMHGIR